MAMLANEKQRGVDKLAFYQQFAERVYALRHALHEKLTHLKSQNKKVAAYGASAKGTTSLYFFGIGDDLIDFVVDRSPHKQGYFTPGTHLPIYAVESLIKEKIDYALLLTWNFADEILQQQQSYRDQGGKFIIPIPELQVV